MRPVPAPARLAIMVTAILAIAACGSSPPGPTPSILVTSPAPSSAPPGDPTAPPASASASPSTGVQSVAADPGLLDVLPRATDGVSRTYDAQTTRRIAADPALIEDAVGLAIALYAGAVGPATTTRDVAIASVVALRNPAADEEWFRQWRDSYDTAACGPAGGVARHAEAEIGGRVVFIGSCAGGAFTYHTRLRDGAVVVSVTSVGPGKLGETIMAGLAE